MRRLLVAAAAAVLIGSFSGFAHDGVYKQDKGPFTLKKLSNDAYALFGRGGNVGFAVTSEGVVVIDDQFENMAPGIAEQIKSVTSQPIRFLINTHHHGDHTGGNGFFIKMSTIVAHDNVRKHMLAAPQEMAANATNQIRSLEQQIAKLQKENAPASDIEGLKQRLNTAKSNLERARATKIEEVPAPNLTFNRELRLYLGGKEIQVFHVKRGHTDGDSIIYMPQDKVVHMGDLFFYKTIPVIDRAHGASTSEWVETIDVVCARVDPASQVIPGHGEVTTVAELKAFKDYFADLRAAVKKAVDAGLARDQAIKEVKIEKYAQYAGYAQRFASNVGVVYDELKAGQ
jgi:glyoxylase-like metal-dependent hydrolase (beta-lactamase superfamily II)